MWCAFLHDGHKHMWVEPQTDPNKGGMQGYGVRHPIHNARSWGQEQAGKWVLSPVDWNWEQQQGPVHAGRMSTFAHKFACKPFDIACKLCEHSYWLQSVPLHVHVARCFASCVNWAQEMQNTVLQYNTITRCTTSSDTFLALEQTHLTLLRYAPRKTAKQILASGFSISSQLQQKSCLVTPFRITNGSFGKLYRAKNKAT